MTSFRIRRKQLPCIVSLVLFCFAFYTLKLALDVGLACDHLQTNVVFLKTHKTASTSVVHLLRRYANKYQRLLVFPKDPFNGVNHKFDRKALLRLKPGYNYSVFADHTIFDYEEMRAVLPGNTKFITILRDPVAQFESAYDYAFMELFYGMNISAFASLNISDPKESKVIRKRLSGSIGINQMAFDLGIDPSLFDDETAILIKIQELDKQLDLVMITELFDQSLILMKEKLCWKDWNDVISFKINVRNAENKARLSSEQKKKLRRMNRADQLIYDHFYQKLLVQIDAFGKEKMEEEVERLRATTREMFALCVDEESTLNGNEIKDEIIAFKLKKEAENNEVCADLTANVFHLLASIFSKQKSLFAEDKSLLDSIESQLGCLYKAYLIWRNSQNGIFDFSMCR